jgi:hypothetical protein
MNDTNLLRARESSRHLSTLLRHEQGVMVELARVMTPENRGEVLPRFFLLSKRQAMAAAASWSLQGGVHMAELRHGCRVSPGRNSPDQPRAGGGSGATHEGRARSWRSRQGGARR